MEQLYKWLRELEKKERENAFHSGKDFDLGYSSACMDILIHVFNLLDKSTNP